MPCSIAKWYKTSLRSSEKPQKTPLKRAEEEPCKKTDKYLDKYPSKLNPKTPAKHYKNRRFGKREK